MSRDEVPERARQSISASMRFRVLQRYDFKCRYCGNDRAPLEIDHAVSLANGGEHSESNFVPACRDCNAGKGAISVAAPNVIIKDRHLAADDILTALHGRKTRRSRYRWFVQRWLKSVDANKLLGWALDASRSHDSLAGRFTALSEKATPEYYRQRG